MGRSNAFGQELVQSNRERGNDCQWIREMKLVWVWNGAGEKRTEKEDKWTRRQETEWGKKNRLHAQQTELPLVGQPWCHSQTMPCSLLSGERGEEGRSGSGGGGEAIKMEKMKRPMRGRVRVEKRQEVPGRMPGLSATASEPMSTTGLSQWETGWCSQYHLGHPPRQRASLITFSQLSPF